MDGVRDISFFRDMDVASPKSPALPHPMTAREVQAVLHAERAGGPFLCFRDGDRELIVRPLDERSTQLTLGRHSRSDVSLPWDDSVSRSHAVLERIGHGWTLVDDGLSRNGTFVNGQRIRARVRLQDRDTVRLGGTLVVFRAPMRPSTAAITRVDDGLLTSDQLTPMQRKVLIALCRPYRDGGGFAVPATNQQIAEELVLSVEAIKTHMRGIFQRFGVEALPQNQKRARAVELAFQSGIVTERDL
jgi:pSer/pThr/pTyr-binding forkhead associated (FHA) protein